MVLIDPAMAPLRSLTCVELFAVALLEQPHARFNRAGYLYHSGYGCGDLQAQELRAYKRELAFNRPCLAARTKGGKS
jgi:hypothetical protein